MKSTVTDIASINLKDPEIDAMIETMKIVSDTSLVQRLKEAEAEFGSGGGRLFQEIQRDLGQQ